MYNVDHPTTYQAAGEFHKTIAEGLEILSPITLVMDRERFFIEDEPLDHRVNPSRMASHFKKAGIQSVSFEKGVRDSELMDFIRVFTDLTKHPTADSMKICLQRKGLQSIRINHVFFRKMTSDEEVVSRDKVREASKGSQKAIQSGMDEVVERMLAGSIAMDELEKTMSIQNLVENPSQFTNTLIEADLSSLHVEQTEGFMPGSFLSHQLKRIRKEVEGAESDREPKSIEEIAEAIFKMRKDLLQGIETQKAMGVVYSEEGMIRHEVDSLTDQVLIRLVKEEYKKGKVSVVRLAQIIRHMMPEREELRRLLPKLKEALLAEGMPLSHFLQLVQELGKELQNEGLTQVLAESAEEIGISEQELIREIKRDPKGAAELISLATEIRRGTGDDKILRDLLVDYIERIGSEMALTNSEQRGVEGGKHLRQLISTIESTLVDRLRKRGMDEQVMNLVGQKLEERLEKIIEQVKSTWLLRQISVSRPVPIDKASLAQVLEESVEDDEEMDFILEHVRASLHDRGVDEEGFLQIYDEIFRRRLERQREREKKDLPKGAFSRGNILYLLRGEILRALRYHYSFSVITFSILKVTPKKLVPLGAVNQCQVKKVILERLVKAAREVDVVGYLDEHKIIVILPMTNKRGSKLAVKRMTKVLQAEPFIVEDIPLEVKFAAVATDFDRERTATVNAFLEVAESELKSLG